MNIKININKIHGDLLNVFETVKIEEKSSLKLGNYFEISSISEGLEVKMILTKKGVESNNIQWSYFTNPLNEKSDIIERISNINNFSEDVKDIITKKRFSEDYLIEINK